MAERRQHKADGEGGIPDMFFSPHLDALLSVRQQQDYIESSALWRHI